MCVVIDVNVLHCVLDLGNHRFADFKPLHTWVTEGPGCIVYGGTKYKKELGRANKYWGMLIELQKTQHAREVCCASVDSEERRISKLLPRSCNDAHIIAIVSAAKCRIVCTDDGPATECLTDYHLYPKKFGAPSVYKNPKHKRLLCKNNICAFRKQLKNNK
jgi:hypothetical protein